MSAEHSKTKPELPIRPPRPHPQGFVRGVTVIAAIVTVFALALSACTPPQGPAGKVVDRHRTYWSATKQWTYKLTVRKTDGGQATFKVLRSDYRSCNAGDDYPACAG